MVAISNSPHPQELKLVGVETKCESKEVENMKNVPEKKFSAGAVSATVWKNEVQGKPGASYFSVGLQRSYKDKDGNWQHTTSLRLNDLPKASLVLERVYEFLVLKETGDEAEAY
ncbi:MAG: hypothetical protein ABIF10_06520 [Candidatus Woesearchaeota archaeon]